MSTSERCTRNHVHGYDCNVHAEPENYCQLHDMFDCPYAHDNIVWAEGMTAVEIVRDMFEHDGFALAGQLIIPDFNDGEPIDFSNIELGSARIIEATHTIEFTQPEPEAIAASCGVSAEEILEAMQQVQQSYSDRAEADDRSVRPIGEFIADANALLNEVDSYRSLPHDDIVGYDASGLPITREG